MKPVRIQRKRTKGWRMPAGVVYVGRGSKFGNPWKVFVSKLLPSLSITAEKSVECYKLLLKARQDGLDSHGRKHEGLPYYDDIRAALKGKDLACWCKIGDPCHADVLLEIANAGEQPEGGK